MMQIIVLCAAYTLAHCIQYIPAVKTIELVLNKLYVNNTTTYNGIGEFSEVSETVIE